MRVFKLVLLGLLVYVVAMFAFFPAAPVVNHYRSQLGPVALQGVSGPLFRGKIARVASTDDLLPLEASNVRWRLALSKLLGGGGAHVDLEAYGGSTRALVSRAWNGDLRVADLELTARAKELEPLLPAPIAAFDGDISADIATVLLENQLLTELEGEIQWSNAVLERPIAARFGTVRIDVSPESDGKHAGTFEANGGDVEGEGNFTVSLNGDFTLNVTLVPSPSAPADLVNSLRRISRPDAEGRYRVQQSGNLNRLL